MAFIAIFNLFLLIPLQFSNFIPFLSFSVVCIYIYMLNLWC